MEFIGMGIAAAVIIALLCGLFLSRKQKKEPEQQPPRRILSVCPLCGSSLAAGEKLFSRVYGPMTLPDQRCTIAGCPHCHPSCEPGVKRTCPVCGKSVGQSGYLVARLFNKAEGKKHVLVTGCTGCCRGVSQNEK